MKSKNKKTVFSAIQPSGNLTIGNYIGAIRQWIKIQNKYNCIFCIADQHAITVRQNPKSLKNKILDTLSLIISCGVDYKKNIIFVQSHIPAHAQLNWVLNCYTYYGELKRMTQFKKKINNNKNINTGLLNYPILMASDILLYKTNYVLIGADQQQHLELTQKIAKRFNKIYGKIFTIPKQLFLDKNIKIMSLQNSQKKMSKSDNNKNNIITLLDEKEKVKQKIQLAETDSDNPPKIYYDIKNKPNISNLINIFSGITEKNIYEIEKQFYEKMYKDFKNSISESIISFLENIQNKFNKFRKNEILLKKILHNGSKKAKAISIKMIKKVYNTIGFM